MSIVITGATGQLGRLTVEALLRRGVPAEQITATGRRTETLSDLADQGVTVRRADYNDPASLDEAFAGADRVLLISSSEVGQRAAQHGNAIDAAKRADVDLVAYTSIPKADSSSLLLAEEHRATEELLAESGLPHVLLRNSWYTENYTAQLPVFLEHGIAGAAGQGRVSAATRADFADAAAAVLTENGHAGATYELGGPAFTMTELADVVTGTTGRTVTYTDLPVEQYTQVLVGAGLPEPVAAVFADGDRGIARGELHVDTSDLEKLLGRPATPLADAVGEAATALVIDGEVGSHS
ncbi:MAG TPA: SDR family oxidoreductase [Nocardioides sp.]|nr:SDR family oxidoreductase [Nocardioides sp.]